MSVFIIENKTIAHSQKEYKCDACLFMRDSLSELSPGMLTFAELREIVKAKQDNYKILKGQPYGKQFNKLYGEEPYTFRYRPAIHEICLKYELYPEI
jgi:hypothetical protein